MNNVKAKIENYCSRLKKTLDALDTENIVNAVNVIRRAFIEGRQIFIMGNGGSAATSSHIACDLNKGASADLGRKFKVICLNDNMPTILATANDLSYEDIFVEQLKNFLRPSDVVVGISGSGNSKNVLKAIEYANQNGGITIGLCGYDGGKLKKVSQHSIHIAINDMQISEDIHLIIGHIMMQIFKTSLNSVNKKTKPIDIKEYNKYDILLEQLCQTNF